MQRILRSICVAAVTLTALTAQGIIIRHDSNPSDYQIRESEQPAVFYLELQKRRKVCVATLIAPRWAITAAHCVDQTSLLTQMHQGKPFAVQVAGTLRRIDRVVVHPDYLPGAPNEVDLALLRFDAELAYPRPIAVYAGEQEFDRVVTLLGWGFYGLGSTGRLYDDGKFRRAENRISRADRRLEITFDDPRQPRARVLDLEGMPGLGDSGGPALLQDDDTTVLAGVAVGEIMADDFDDETQGHYGAQAVYERLSLHRDWIDAVIRGRQ